MASHRTTAIYARYSSELQNPRSCEDQVADLRRGLRSTPRVFSDSATSGSTWERPGLQALLRAVEEGSVSELYVEHPDRLSRDLGDLDRIGKLLQHHDVKLVCSNGVTLDGSAGAALTYGITAVLSENYLRELGVKTMRGLRANARDGRATGGRAYGYRTDADTKAIQIVEEEARVLRDIFRMYQDGYGYAAIAARLNELHVPPPRGSKRRAGAGWMASAICEQLRNPKYVGEWRFGVRQWRKHPSTRKRQPRASDEADVIVEQRPDLAIIDRENWDAVQARLAEHAANYKKRSTEGRTVPRQRTDYLLSGLLRCACCGSVMDIMAGSSARYYRCSANRKRGTCTNRLSVKEPVARDRILQAIADALWHPDALVHIRARVAERLGELRQELDRELRDRRARLARHEGRIRELITMQLDGDKSPYLKQMRADFEAQALQERAAVATLQARAEAPMRLPSPQELAEDRILTLDALREAEGEEVAPAREQLRRLLKGGSILLHPENGVYVARAELMPLEVLLGAPKSATPSGGGQRASSRSGCADRI